MIIEHQGDSRKIMDTREWYDFLAQMAGILPGIHQGGALATRELLAMSNLTMESLVLDVGCGFGSTATMIASQYGARVHGVDLAPVMIEKAKARGARLGLDDSIEFRVADATQLPFEDAAFDRIILESVLTPLAGDKLAALREMMRVLTPDGLIGINEGIIDLSAPPELLTRLEEHPGIYGTFSADTLRALLESAGLHVLKFVLKKPEQMSEKPRMKVGALLHFMVKVYPKIMLQMLRDRRLREVSKIDDAVTRGFKKYAGCALVIAQK